MRGTSGCSGKFIAFSAFRSLVDNWPSWTEQAGKKQGLWPMSAFLACKACFQGAGYPDLDLQHAYPLVWVLVCRCLDTVLVLEELGVPSNAFMALAFGVTTQISSPNPRSSRFSPMLSSRRFIVLHFAFKSVIHFDLIFMKVVRSVSRFIFFHVDAQLLQHLPFV